MYASVVTSGRPAARFSPGQFVTVFRSRLRPESEAAYGADVVEIAALAETMPGLVDIKDFTSADGERLSVITFADEVSQEAWRRQVDHVAAQGRGRSDYYTEYSLQVCSAVRVSSWPAGRDASDHHGTDN
jgi:heme-degrading monooxygenase HmoA